MIFLKNDLEIGVIQAPIDIVTIVIQVLAT